MSTQENAPRTGEKRSWSRRIAREKQRELNRAEKLAERLARQAAKKTLIAPPEVGSLPPSSTIQRQDLLTPQPLVPHRPHEISIPTPQPGPIRSNPSEVEPPLG